MRAYIEAEPFHVNPQTAIRVTASVGLATLERVDDTPETLYKRADNGLYARVIGSRPMVALGEISYEIFLLHVMVMTLTIGLLLRWPPFTGPVAVLWALTLALTIPPAWLLHRCTAPRSLREADQASLRNAGSSKASARPRCDAASLASGLSSAAEQVPPSGRNTGS